MKPSEQFNHHDHIDRDVITISKHSLLAHLQTCANNASVPANAVGFGGVAISLITAGLLTESFRSFGLIPGETFRGIFIVGGFCAAVPAIKALYYWKTQKSDSAPEEIVRTLVHKSSTQPVALLTAPKPVRKTLRKNVSKRTKVTA